MKFSIIVTLKKDVLDPQGKVVEQTLQNLGMSTLKGVRQGKYFEINIDENDETKANNNVDEMCQKLLVNLTIEEYKILKI